MIPEHVRNRNALIVEVLKTLGVDVSVYWSAEGPTEAARELKPTLYAGETSTWVRLAWSLYDGSPCLSVAELLEAEEQKCILALTLLMRVPMGTVGLASILMAGGNETDDGGGESVN